MEQQQSLVSIKEQQVNLADLQHKLSNELGDRGDSQVQVDEELTQLRAKTREVEEIGMKIDESVKMCQDTETLILNLGRYNDEAF